jgi:hypothetical protein
MLVYGEETLGWEGLITGRQTFLWDLFSYFCQRGTESPLTYG